MVTSAIALMLFPAAMAYAASSDLLTMTISNRISIVLVVGFFALALAMHMSGSDIAMHAGAGLLVLVIAFVLFSLHWIGGGDAKLAAGIALWLGWSHLLEYALLASVFGGALTVLLLEFRRWALPAPLLGKEWIERLHDRKGGVPYGIALAIAALVVYPHTGWMAGLGG